MSNPNPDSPKTKECKQWFEARQDESFLFGIPEICDYECRREYFQNRSIVSIQRLDKLTQRTDRLVYWRLTTGIVHKAAQLWGEARNKGIVLADKKSLDGDVLLIATAINIVEETEEKVIIATTDESDLSNFNNRRLVSLSWEKITLELCVAFEMGKYRYAYGKLW
ncbi:MULTISPECIES: nucleic acid-binding protein [unclassified Leptolyngbya]|uniref:nucleic acid-binding protein n=1 Tax=unclassified Leptolyngbya TaxID=2650499 RepID=UPI0016845A28|nr:MULTISPECIES: nucleic acid-binding protein [unclassified Leptolyngbya]MBD1912873.1 nucleic acid-binding protein [Leptolyngbya sp. FACHB-8]MBD2154798.1 nucleic acid-binding protein [Leptolyngbya sp. FACHB-16]